MKNTPRQTVNRILRKIRRCDKHIIDCREHGERPLAKRVRERRRLCTIMLRVYDAGSEVTTCAKHPAIDAEGFIIPLPERRKPAGKP